MDVRSDDDLNMGRADDFNAWNARFLDLRLIDRIHVFHIDAEARDTRLNTGDVLVTTETVVNHCCHR